MHNMTFRHELKYDISYKDYLTLRSRLKQYAEYDENASDRGYYKIHTLYIDDSAGESNEIFRIRYYNNNPAYMVLEKKTVINSLCINKNTVITKEMCLHILKNDTEYISGSEDMLVRELYIKMKSRMMRPLYAEHHIREPFYLNMGKIRITIDRKIHTTSAVDEFFEMPKLSAGIFSNIIMGF
ncbi:MAG: VTC domain-containing protein, partial [Oscillospiraceae bacterium]|nr:VTC domain-containing protein [Oscillospiraceae bacterium]